MSSNKTFKIINTLHQRLHNFSANGSENPNKIGIIFGFTPISQNNCSYAIGCSASLEDIPFGNVLIGAYFLEVFNEEFILNFCYELSKDKKTGKLLAYSYHELKEQILFYDIKLKKLSQGSHEIVKYQEALELLVQIQLDFILHLNLSYNDNFQNNINVVMENLNNSVFHLKKSKFKIGAENIPNTMCIDDLYNQIEEFDELMDVQLPANMKKKMIEKSQKQLKNKKSTINFQLETDLQKSFIPKTLIIEKGKTYDFNMEMKIFYNLQLKNNLQQLHKIFLYSLNKMLIAMQKYFNSAINREMDSFSLPKVVNFYEPSLYTHIITCIYHDIHSQDEYKKQRKSIHLKYLIPMTTPVFKLGNVLGCNYSGGKKLINVHLGLSSGIKNGLCSIVKGKYFYFHYNQDHIDDAGWGCAYRSLQTIISWFQLQGYIDIEVIPTHKEIQQALIDVGDKPNNFLGSNKWIGSQEVCYVLSHLYGIQSKIIFINSATELVDKARELIQHFLVNGTPIMIGGGVLAHTIIGVDFDETTGNVKYLVLDPHYIGDEDVSNIIKKSGCSWKPVTFWNKNTFYNLCLPQVQIIEIQKGRIISEMKLTKECCNPVNYLHGGMSATFIDVMSSMALRAHFEAENQQPPITVSLELSLSFLAGVPEGNTIRLETETLRVGKNVAFLTANIYDKETNKLAVTGKHTKFLL